MCILALGGAALPKNTVFLGSRSYSGTECSLGAWGGVAAQLWERGDALLPIHHPPGTQGWGQTGALQRFIWLEKGSALGRPSSLWESRTPG